MSRPTLLDILEARRRIESHVVRTPLHHYLSLDKLLDAEVYVKHENHQLLGAFKVPSLRNVANTAPYMHNGRLEDLDAVLRHYNAAPPAFPGHSDLVPLALTEEQSGALKAFLHTLSAAPDAPPELLRPPEDRE